MLARPHFAFLVLGVHLRALGMLGTHLTFEPQNHPTLLLQNKGLQTWGLLSVSVPKSLSLGAQELRQSLARLPLRA